MNITTREQAIELLNSYYSTPSTKGAIPQLAQRIFSAQEEVQIGGHKYTYSSEGPQLLVALFRKAGYDVQDFRSYIDGRTYESLEDIVVDLKVAESLGEKEKVIIDRAREVMQDWDIEKIQTVFSSDIKDGYPTLCRLGIELASRHVEEETAPTSIKEPQERITGKQADQAATARKVDIAQRRIWPYVATTGLILGGAGLIYGTGGAATPLVLRFAAASALHNGALRLIDWYYPRSADEAMRAQFVRSIAPQLASSLAYCSVEGMVASAAAATTKMGMDKVKAAFIDPYLPVKDTPKRIAADVIYDCSTSMALFMGASAGIERVKKGVPVFKEMTKYVNSWIPWAQAPTISTEPEAKTFEGFAGSWEVGQGYSVAKGSQQAVRECVQAFETAQLSLPKDLIGLQEKVNTMADGFLKVCETDGLEGAKQTLRIMQQTVFDAQKMTQSLIKEWSPNLGLVTYKGFEASMQVGELHAMARDAVIAVQGMVGSLKEVPEKLVALQKEINDLESGFLQVCESRGKEGAEEVLNTLSEKLIEAESIMKEIQGRTWYGSLAQKVSGYSYYLVGALLTGAMPLLTRYKGRINPLA